MVYLLLTCSCEHFNTSDICPLQTADSQIVSNCVRYLLQHMQGIDILLLLMDWLISYCVATAFSLSGYSEFGILLHVRGVLGFLAYSLYYGRPLLIN